MERSTPWASNYLLDKTPLEELVVRGSEDTLNISTNNITTEMSVGRVFMEMKKRIRK